MFNMVESKVVRINRTLYVRVPAEEARRLGLAEGMIVDVDVKKRSPVWGEVRHRFPLTSPTKSTPTWEALKKQLDAEDYFGEQARWKKLEALAEGKPDARRKARGTRKKRHD